MDYLSTRQEIDSTRFGLIGSSIGGLMSIILTGVDTRIRATVACVVPTMKPREFLQPEEVFRSGFSTSTFAPAIHQPVLMLMGNRDRFNYTVDEANQLYTLIESQKKI